MKAETQTQPGRLYIMQPFKHSCGLSDTRNCPCWLPVTEDTPRGADGLLSGVVRYRHVPGLNRHDRRALARRLMGRTERKLLKEAQ
jgi:hypothetical protein